MFSGCPLEGGGTNNGIDSGTDNGKPEQPPPVYSAPALLGAIVRYDEPDWTPTVTFTFDVNVTVPSGQGTGWTIQGSGTKTVTASLIDPAPGTPATISLTVANSSDHDKTGAVSETVMPVDEGFTRPGTPTAYTLVYYDKHRAAGLRTGNGEPRYYYVPPPGSSQRDPADIFNALYTPNASKPAALGLFKITFGTESSADKIEITAEAPGAAPIVVDLGLPDAANDGLPLFRIPSQGLEIEGSWGLRVNRGAALVIEDGNGGSLAGGRVEVMKGGMLRSMAAYGSFPLGTGAAIILRLGSRFTVGPGSGDLLVGPSDSGAKAEWGIGDQNGGYIEIRRDALAFDANLSIRKSLELRYSVWFVNGPTLTINAADNPGGGAKGLFADPEGEGGRKFYGTAGSFSGGQNPSRSAAVIIIRKGSSLSRSFLTAAGTGVITAENADITITNQGGDTPTSYGDGSARGGYWNWEIPALTQ
jgi:hypothetical protein